MKFILGLLLCLIYATAIAADDNRPLISIIIDDMGNRSKLDRQAITLPGPITCSILPYSVDAVQIANIAHTENKEIIAHIPMQAIDGQYMGPGGLGKNMSQQQFDQVLIGDLNAVPYIEGMNNHMGSLLTQCPKQMSWLMQVLKPTRLFYVDSRTTPKTVAERIADQYGVPTIHRDVFLDHIATADEISRQFARLIVIARKQGYAVAIGHPYPITLRYLQQEIPQLHQQGIEIVPLSELVADREYMLQVMHGMS